MQNVIRASFGISDLLPDEAIISRHFNNLIETYGREQVYHTVTGIVVYETLTAHFLNLCFTYTSEVVLDVWYTMYVSNTQNKAVKNG